MALDAEIFADMFDEVDRSTCVAGAVCVLNAVALVNAAVATNVVAVNAVEIAVVADNAVAVTSTASGRAIESGHQMPLYLPAREQAV